MKNAKIQPKLIVTYATTDEFGYRIQNSFEVSDEPAARMWVSRLKYQGVVDASWHWAVPHGPGK